MHFDIWFSLFVALVALMAATGAVLLLVGYIDAIPMSVASGWGWAAVTVLVPVVGPIYFCYNHWDDCSKTGKQLIGAAVLLALALGLTYGIGPWFAARAMSPVPAA